MGPVVEVMCFDEGERSREPGNTAGLWKLEKARKQRVELSPEIARTAALQLLDFRLLVSVKRQVHVVSRGVCGNLSQ